MTRGTKADNNKGQINKHHKKETRKPHKLGKEQREKTKTEN